MPDFCTLARHPLLSAESDRVASDFPTKGTALAGGFGARGPGAEVFHRIVVFAAVTPTDAVVIRRATPGAWRWLGYVARDAEGLYVPGAPVLEAEAFGPLPPA